MHSLLVLRRSKKVACTNLRFVKKQEGDALLVLLYKSKICMSNTNPVRALHEPPSCLYEHSLRACTNLRFVKKQEGDALLVLL